jgi:hypothetical protein
VRDRIQHEVLPSVRFFKREIEIRQSRLTKVVETMAKMMTRLLTIALVIGCAAGFTVPKEPVSHTYLSAVSSRRAFLDVSLLTGVGLVVGYNPAFAEDAPNDLVMPTEAEQQVR